MKHKHACPVHEEHEGSLINELAHHFPYAVISVAIGIITLSLLGFFGFGSTMDHAAIKGMRKLFHSFHFLHLIFAASGSLITFSRFSRNIAKGFFVSLVSALVFCTLTDILLPYIGGSILGMPMRLHICFSSELHNVIPFLAIGLLNGLVISKYGMANKSYSLAIHVGHILCGSMASLFYLVSEGFANWYPYMGIIFILLIIAVVLPCTLADIIIPVLVARSEKA
jgi:hypothetical protein